VPGIPGSRTVVRHLMGAHPAIYRATHGLIGHRLPGLPPILVLDHVGARSGTKRSSALLYVEDGDNLVVIASKGGSRSIRPGSTT
jgi:hypothetical protein